VVHIQSINLLSAVRFHERGSWVTIFFRRRQLRSAPIDSRVSVSARAGARVRNRNCPIILRSASSRLGGGMMVCEVGFTRGIPLTERLSQLDGAGGRPRVPRHSEVTVGLTRPLMAFDGDCGFCRNWVARWRRRTGDGIDYVPYQQIADEFPGFLVPNS